MYQRIFQLLINLESESCYGFIVAIISSYFFSLVF